MNELMFSPPQLHLFALLFAVIIFPTSPSLFPPNRRSYNTEESNHSPALHPIPLWSACSGLFVFRLFFSFYFFFLLPFMEPLEPGADGKIVAGGK